MFGKTVSIIAISKERILGAKVKTRGKKKVRKSVELGWEPETLDVALSKIKKQLRVRTARILLSDELSYIVRVKVPFDLTESEKRKFISEKISAQIPERLEKGDWDYKEISFDLALDDKKTEEEHEVIVFSPVKHFFKKLSRAVEKVGLEIEAIEPEAIAKTRDTNPLVGLAMKKDIKGKDKDVLNLEPLEVDIEVKEDSDLEGEGLLIDEAKRIQMESDDKFENRESGNEIEEAGGEAKKKPRGKFLPIVLLLILIGLAVFYYFYFVRPSDDVEQAPANQEESVQVEPTETPQEPEEKEELDLSEYKIQVQNGSGLAGEALVVSEILQAEGFSDIKEANADSYDYLETQVWLKDQMHEDIFNTVDRALNSDYSVVRQDELLDGDSEFDIVVVVGTRIEI